MSGKGKVPENDMEHAEKTRSKDARKVVHDFLCVVKKIGASEDTITKEEQNQMRVKPSKPFKKVERMLNDESFFTALLDQMDELPSTDRLAPCVRCIAKLSTIPEFAMQIGRHDIASRLFRFGQRFLSETKGGAVKNPDPYEQSPEIYYTNITANLLESSAEFRETARKAGLLRQFIDLFRRRWENVWCHWQGRNIVFLVLSIQQAALTFQAHVEHSMQDLKDLVVDVAEWASDFLLFLDQSWDKVVEEPALDQFRRSSLLEILLDSYVRLLSTLMRHGLKALPGIKRRSRELSKIFTTKILRYFDTARFTQRHVHLVSKQREVFEDAAEYFQRETENDDMCRTPKATENADSSLLSEIFMKLQNSGAGKAGCLLNLAAKQLDKCTAEQAESLISEGAASITLRALVGLSVPEVNSKAGAETVTLSERSAITGRALQVLKKLILKVEKSRKPALQGSFFEICVGLLEWTSAVKLLDRSAGFVALDEKLETDVYNAVLCFLMETELWDLRELSERLQMQYVDLAVSAIKLNPFSETASIAWATLSSLKGAAYENRSSRVTIANEYLWHPGSEPVKLASDSQQLRNCCMYNIGKIYHERGLMALSLKELRHVQQSRFRLFGLPRYVLSVLQVCCFAAPIERALLPDFESVIQTLDLVRNTMLAAFGPFGPFDGPPPKRFDSMTGEDILNEALFNLFEIFGAFLGALDDPATHPKLRRQVLLRIVRGNGPALCAKVLRDFCTFQAALPDKAAEQERIPPVQRRVKRLWEVQALEFGLRACSNPECEDKLVEESKGTFQKCGRCGLARYCSKNCQTKHWATGHRRECSAPTTGA